MFYQVSPLLFLVLSYCITKTLVFLELYLLRCTYYTPFGKWLAWYILKRYSLARSCYLYGIPLMRDAVFRWFSCPCGIEEQAVSSSSNRSLQNLLGSRLNPSGSLRSANRFAAFGLDPQILQAGVFLDRRLTCSSGRRGGDLQNYEKVYCFIC